MQKAEEIKNDELHMPYDSKENKCLSCKENSKKISGNWLYTNLILFSIVFQKISLPLTNNTLSINTALLPIFIIVAIIHNIVFVDIYAFFIYILLFLFVMVCVIMFSHNQTSLAPVALLMLAQAPLTTRALPHRFDQTKALHFYSSAICLVSFIGVLQFGSEWIIPRQFSFPLDFFIPDNISVQGYNNLNPLEYASDRIKSNGLFFIEPSVFSQQIALATLIELQGRSRIIRIIIFAAGMLVSYSGTGLLILILFGALTMVRKGNLTPLLVFLAVGTLCFLFADTLRIGTMTQRVFEFNQTGTSGTARFLSVFTLIDLYQLGDLKNIFFGLGPGQITTYIEKLPYEGFGPTWGKIIFEYGIVGLCVYAFFLIPAIIGGKSQIGIPILFTYLFLGGYLENSDFLILLVVFCCWAPRGAAEVNH